MADELTGKGQTAQMDPDALEQLMVTMEWSTEADFDLAALWEAPSIRMVFLSCVMTSRAGTS